jgi:SAM-dependent methyltransferase
MKKIKAKKKDLAPLKLDLGCGPHKREGFHGVDAMKFPNVDTIHDLRKAWPWKDGSVDEAHSSHFIEHLTGEERVHFYNELYRVLKPGAKAMIIAPDWSSGRSYGDPTHKYPPICGDSFYYLDKGWRAGNAPHCGLTCDFLATWGYSIHPGWEGKNQETLMFGMAHYREVAQDIMVTLTKR